MMEFFMSVVSGGATGLLGVLMQRFFDHKAKQLEVEVVKLNHLNALALSDKESERMRARVDADVQVAKEEAQARVEVAELDTQARETEADAKNLQASFENDKATYLPAEAVKGGVAWLMALVDFLRGILRPGLTAYLAGLVTVMFFWVRDLAEVHGVSITGEQAVMLMNQIIAAILYVFVTSTTWWFGSRPQAKGA
jgi:hypothetical protein